MLYILDILHSFNHDYMLSFPYFLTIVGYEDSIFWNNLKYIWIKKYL